MLKLKVGDTIKVTLGKDKGREGKIEKIDVKAVKAIVPGVNMYKKHVKGVGEVKGGIYDIPRALSFGKIALVCPKCKKVTRVGFKFAGKEKVRVCRKCGKEIDTK
jgi:large subunit ribosomal protein L24